MNVNETTNSTIDNYDIPAPLVILVVFVMSVLSTVGTIGNILVITTVYVHQKLRSPGNVYIVFVINLAIADLIVTTIVIPLAVVGTTEYGDILKHNDGLCNSVGSLVVISCVTSILSIAQVALARYLCVFYRPGKYDKFYTRATIPLMVTATWFYAILMDFPSHEIVGWGQRGYNHKIRACTFLFADSQVKDSRAGYMVFLSAFGWGIPFVLTCFCYTSLYLHLRQHNSSSQNATIDSSTMTERATLRIKADGRRLKNLAIIFFLFCLMWTPLPVTGFVHKHVVKLPDWVPFLCSHLAVANSCVNFIVYRFNKDFKEGYRLTWKKITRKDSNQN